MEQTLSENLQLGQLVANALSEIERLGYSRRSRNRYRAIWEHLIEFSRRNQLEDKLSADLAARFLEEYGVRSEAVDEPGNGWRRHLLFGLKVLADFAKTGVLNERSRIYRPFTFTPPCRTHFEIMNSTARIDYTFEGRVFGCVPQTLRFFCIFSIQRKRGN
jgi:hypothetical protein